MTTASYFFDGSNQPGNMSGDATGAVQISGAGITTITVNMTSDGWLKGPQGLRLHSGATLTTWKASINGDLTGTTGDGLMFDGTAASTITVGTEGVVSGATIGMVTVGGASFINHGIIQGVTRAIAANAGTDAVTVTNTGTMTSSGAGSWTIYLTGTAKHTITNSGTITGDDHSIAININTMTSSDDVVTNNATGILNGAVDMGYGNDTLTNKGKIFGAVDLGPGANVLTNSGTIQGTVFSGKDADKITNSGSIFGPLNTGDGNDIVKNSGQIGTVDMGLGNDTYTGGSKLDVVVDNMGKDTYKLGAGNDFFFAIQLDNSNANISKDGNIDTIDGGSSALANGSLGDTYDAHLAVSSLSINLDSTAHTGLTFDSAASQLAHQADGSDIGTDKITGFEIIELGNGVNHVWGSAAAEQFDGGNSADLLYGYGGNDILNGKGGADLLWGGLGADQIDVGQNDAATDLILYTSVKESTVAIAGRDSITNFVSVTNGTHNDVVEFNHMGPLQLHSGNFVDVQFSGAHGEVRVLESGTGWTIQVDTNGDFKADMAIDVVDATHQIAWTAGNFVFVL